MMVYMILSTFCKNSFSVLQQRNGIQASSKNDMPLHGIITRCSFMQRNVFCFSHFEVWSGLVQVSHRFSSPSPDLE